MKAVLWDLDDTLLDSLPARMKALSHAYERCLGTRTDPYALWRSNRGGTLEALGQRLLGDGYQRFADTYRDYYYNSDRAVRPYAGVQAALEQLAVLGVPMGIVTSKTSWIATEDAEASGLLPYFAVLVGCDDTDQHKPDPEPVYAAMARLFLDEPGDVLLVGDSPADVFAARNAGCVPVAATWGTLDEELLLDAFPVHVVRAPGEVPGLLRAAASEVAP